MRFHVTLSLLCMPALFSLAAKCNVVTGYINLCHPYQCCKVLLGCINLYHMVILIRTIRTDPARRCWVILISQKWTKMLVQLSFFFSFSFFLQICIVVDGSLKRSISIVLVFRVFSVSSVYCPCLPCIFVCLHATLNMCGILIEQYCAFFFLLLLFYIFFTNIPCPHYGAYSS